jgi:PAS domain S-box-containing protein
MNGSSAENMRRQEEIIAALKGEIEELSQQVKRLIQAEGKLYDFQERLDAQLREYAGLYDLTRRLATLFEIPDVFACAVDYAINNLGYERVIFFQQSDTGEGYGVCAADGYYDQTEKERILAFTIPRDAPLLGSLAHGTAYLLWGGEQEEEGLAGYCSSLGMHEYLVYPLGPRDQPLALLVVGNSAGNARFYRRVREDEETLLAIGNFAELLSSSLENKFYYARMRAALEQERLAKAKYQGIFENSVEGIFQSSPQGRFISCNPAIAAILGYDSPHELINSNHDIERQLYVNPRQRRELFARLMNGQDVKNFEVELYRKDRSCLWALLNVRPSFDGEGKLLFIDGILQDVTERKRSEDTLNKLSQAVEQSPVSVIITDTRGVVEFVNAQFIQLSGYGRDEVMGSIPYILRPESTSPEINATIWETIRDGRVWEGEILNRKKSGETYSEHVTLSPVRNREGAISHYLAIQEDITDRKAAQQARLENASIKRELEIAQEIQRSFLPDHLPELAGLETACRCEPAANVGGDYYDFFYPAPRILDVVIADVAGHSVGSALLMAETRSVLHAMTRLNHSPSRLLATVNSLLYDDLSRAELLNSMFYARLDLNSGTLIYANAGHTRSQLFRADDRSFEELDADGLLMGVKREVFFEERETGLSPGDILLLHTDGITESENGEGVLFGADRLRETIRRHGDRPAPEIIAAVFQELSAFTGARNHGDDMTMVVIRVGASSDTAPPAALQQQ